MALVCVVANAHAQPPQELSLAGAVTMALAREPSLRAARAELEAARGMRRQAGLRANPSLMVERREEPAGTDNQTMVQVSLPLELFRRSARVEAADREIEVTDGSVADRARLLVNDVKMRYGQAAAALRDRDVAADLAASARRELELLTRRVEAGASPPLERDLLEVEVRRLESARFLAAGQADAALFGLKRALGLTAGSPMILQDTLEALAPVEPPGPSGSLERPDVLEAEARVRLADARIGEAQSAGRFDVSVFGSYMRMDAGFAQRGFTAAGDLERVRGVFGYISGGAMVMLPLWNRNQGQIDAFRAERAAAAGRLEAVQLAADAERAAALVQARQTGLALSVIAGSIKLARRNLDVVRQTYELGRGTLGEVLAEQRRYFEIENEYTSALRNAFEARVELESAQGAIR
jgi:cobalt-zinc-cadmium efflux system outer membrane protein